MIICCVFTICYDMLMFDDWWVSEQYAHVLLDLIYSRKCLNISHMIQPECQHSVACVTSLCSFAPDQCCHDTVMWNKWEVMTPRLPKIFFVDLRFFRRSWQILVVPPISPIFCVETKANLNVTFEVWQSVPSTALFPCPISGFLLPTRDNVVIPDKRFA